MNKFLPVSKEDMRERGWEEYDFLCVTGDAYVDHPSFGFAIITRVLESQGYRVGVLAQPKDFTLLGKPRLGILITAGNIDSMVANYTVTKKKRRIDDYSEGGRTGLRPDYAASVYARAARKAYPDVPIFLGGLEASLRRFAHYDYWSDSVMSSIANCADGVMFGMGEDTVCELAARLRDGRSFFDIRAIAYRTDTLDVCAFPYVMCPSYEQVKSDKTAYAKAARIQLEQADAIRGLAVVQPDTHGFIVVNPPALPIETERFDEVYELPYTRTYHPMYKDGVKAIEEVRFSIIHNRGCFGGCSFCSLAFHQGRMISVRSHESVVNEAKLITKMPDFKGYIHDVGGPTANFRHTSCEEQKTRGMCKHGCLAPSICKNLRVDHSDYLALLRKLRALDGVKKVFIRSGIRFDYLIADKNPEFFEELVEHHISGQLKVAPEHCVDHVLERMGKPYFDVYLRFEREYRRLNKRFNKNQFLVPYLISSHPGCTYEDAVKLSEYLKSINHCPEQVQDFYPTPGTISTCMFYTDIDPRDMSRVYTAKTHEEKMAQRALLQWKKPEFRAINRAAGAKKPYTKGGRKK